MGYINEFRGKLASLIEEGKEAEAVKYAADTVLESYRNGQEAGQGGSVAGGNRETRRTGGPRKNAGRA
jgi:hypothetical protein